MFTFWNAFAALVGSVASATLALSLWLAMTTYVSSLWPVALRELLLNELYRRGCTEDTPFNTMEENRFGAVCRAAEYAEKHSEEAEIRAVSLLALRGESATADAVQDVLDDASAASTVALGALAERLTRIGSHQLALRLLPILVVRVKVPLWARGLRDSAVPMARRAGDRAARVFGYAAVVGTTLGVILWSSLLASTRQVPSSSGDSTDYVSTCITVISVLALVVFLTMEATTVVRTLPGARRMTIRERLVFGVFVLVAGASIAALQNGTLTTVAESVTSQLGPMLRARGWDEAKIGGMGIAAACVWLAWPGVRRALDRRSSAVHRIEAGAGALVVLEMSLLFGLSALIGLAHVPMAVVMGLAWMVAATMAVGGLAGTVADMLRVRRRRRDLIRHAALPPHGLFNPRLCWALAAAAALLSAVLTVAPNSAFALQTLAVLGLMGIMTMAGIQGFAYWRYCRRVDRTHEEWVATQRAAVQSPQNATT